MGSLKTKFEDWVTGRQRGPIDQLKFAMKVLTAGFMLFVVVLIIVFMLQIKQRDQQLTVDRRQAAAQAAALEQQRVDRSVETCKQANKSQTSLRAAFPAVIGKALEQLVEANGDPTGRGQTFVDQITPALSQAANGFLPYRNCSIDCIDKFFSPTQGECPPASDENGDP